MCISKLDVMASIFSPSTLRVRWETETGDSFGRSWV